MPRRRKSSRPSDQLMDILMEFSDYSWKFGAIISVVFLFLSGWAYRWAYAFNHPVNPDHLAKAFAEGFGWLIYLVPIMLFALTCLFAWRAIISYSRTQRV